MQTLSSFNRNAYKIFIAIENDNLDELKKLLPVPENIGIIINIDGYHRLSKKLNDKIEWRFLEFAVSRNKQNIVEYLVDTCEAKIGGTRKFGSSEFHHAVNNADENMLDYLISKSSQFDLNESSGVTPIYLAVKKNKLSMFKKLLEARRAHVFFVNHTNSMTPWKH